jgi:hypothetical protein
MVSPPGRLGHGVKQMVPVWLCPEELADVGAFAAELSQQSCGAAFSRAEALRMAALEWRKARQARRASGPISPSLSAPEAARVVTEAVTTVPAPSPPAVTRGAGDHTWTEGAGARWRHCGTRSGRGYTELVASFQECQHCLPWP